MVQQQDLARAMKAGMRHLASGVAIAATRGGDGVPHAMTVTSITSVSDQPPSLLVCLHRETATYRSLDSTEWLSLSVLHEGQESTSHRCAFIPDNQDRFLTGGWQNYGKQEIPYLPDALASFFCRVSRKLDYGTHCIVIADIVHVISTSEAAQPLIYCRGDYATLA